MTLAYLGLFILLLTCFWGFFAVARIHAYKFKNMSTQIPIATNILLVTLLVLSVIGIVLCFFLDTSSKRDTFVEEYIEEDIQLDQEIF